MSVTITDEIREVLRDHARLPVGLDGLDDESDLFDAGMSSFASVNVMLALEDRFEIEFPDELLTRSAFESIASLRSAVSRLRAQA